MVTHFSAHGTNIGTGTYDFRSGVVLLPSGVVTSPTPAGANMQFISPSGRLALWDGASWKSIALTSAVANPGLTVMQSAIIWMDLGAGSASGQSPTSVVTNPSGATTGVVMDGTLSYAVTSGNNAWVFADNGAIEIAGVDKFQFNTAAGVTWEKTWLCVWKMSGTSTANRSVWGYQLTSNGNQNPLRMERASDALGNYIRFQHAGTWTTTTVVTNNSCHASFICLSGMKIGANCWGSGAYYAGKGGGENLSQATMSVAPGISSGVIGDIGSTNSGPFIVWCWAGWDKILTAQERSDVVDYFAGRGISVQ